MDINTLRGIATVLVFIAFCAIFFWVFKIKRREDFELAANLPFADEPPGPTQTKTAAAPGERPTTREVKAMTTQKIRGNRHE